MMFGTLFFKLSAQASVLASAVTSDIARHLGRQITSQILKEEKLIADELAAAASLTSDAPSQNVSIYKGKEYRRTSHLGISV
ncbi:hypothetical protein NC651_035339 [Populus alba x Populus x berolinensis]|nr:hypothetical protein NC651_035339 [Populus alba x Populus x berolinensis]